jgi:hypothetical protein
VVAPECGGTGESIEIRAFRGSRRTSVYHEHVVGESAFQRIVEAAATRGLPLLSSLDRFGAHELDKRRARQLAAEVDAVRMGGELLDLDGELTAIAEVARWCARAPGESWLTVAGP